MKNKKLFAILTLVCFMMTLMPVAAFAATAPVIKTITLTGTDVEGNAFVKSYDYVAGMDLNLNVGEIYKQNKDYKNAEKHWIILHQVDTQNFEALYKLLFLYLYDMEDEKKALKICDKMINIEPEMYSLYLNKAIVLSTFGNLVEAEKQLNIAKEINDGTTRERTNGCSVDKLNKVWIIYPEF